MKTRVLSWFFILILSGYTASAFSDEPSDPIRIDVLYMDHGPMQPTLRELRALFPDYESRVAVYWHDFESEEGERFKTQKGIRRHIPLVIWIDGKSRFRVNGQMVALSGFPTGSGPSFFQGKWKMADLKSTLDRLTGVY